jgi:hypothetical protein
VFREVREYTSSMYPAEHQLFVYEDLTRLPTPEMPLRQPVQGGRHEDAVPVCIK